MIHGSFPQDEFILFNKAGLNLDNSDEIILTSPEKTKKRKFTKIIEQNKLTKSANKELIKDENDFEELRPGKGKRILLNTTLTNGVKIVSLLDTGASTTICTRKLVKENDIKYFQSKIPICFWGLFGASGGEIRDIAIITTTLPNGDTYAIPAYIVEELPNNVDILIGTDQISKSMGIEIPCDSKHIKVSFQKKNKELLEYFLSEDIEGELVTHKTDLEESFDIFLETGYSTRSVVDKNKSANSNRNGVINSASKGNPNPQKTTNDANKSENELIIDHLGNTTDRPSKKDQNPFERQSETILSPPKIKISATKFDNKLLRIMMETKSIKKGIKHLREKIRQLDDDIVKLSDSKLQKGRKIRFKNNTIKKQVKILDNEKSDITEMIEALNKALKNLERTSKNIARATTRAEARRNTKVINDVLKQTIVRAKPSEFRSLISTKLENIAKDNNSNIVKEDVIIGSVDIIELLIDRNTSKFRRNNVGSLESAKLSDKTIPQQIEEIYHLTDRLNTGGTLLELEREILNFVRVEARKDIASDIAHKESTAEHRIDYESKEERKYVPHILIEEQAELLNELLRDNTDVLVPKTGTIEMGKANTAEYDIKLKEGGLERLLNKKKFKPYNIKFDLREILRNTLQEMENTGVGEWSRNHKNFEMPDFVTPTFFTKNKQKYRMVHDYKDLNEETKPMLYPIPRIDSILENLKGKKYFTVLDLKSGYYQIKLSERAAKYCGVVSPEGVFKFHCLPFGLTNGPPFFQMTMENALGDALGIYAYVYIDDIVIFNDSYEEHLAHVQQILNKLRDANLKTNIEKCHFCMKEIKLLGKIISEEGIKVDPELIESMKNYPLPNTPKKVTGFIALCNYYRDHIDNFGALTEPLAKLARSDFIWTNSVWKDNPKALDCFNKMKNVMCVVLQF